MFVRPYTRNANWNSSSVVRLAYLNILVSHLSILSHELNPKTLFTHRLITRREKDGDPKSGTSTRRFSSFFFPVKHAICNLLLQIWYTLLPSRWSASTPIKGTMYAISRYEEEAPIWKRVTTFHREYSPTFFFFAFFMMLANLQRLCACVCVGALLESGYNNSSNEPATSRI